MKYLKQFEARWSIMRHLFGSELLRVKAICPLIIKDIARSLTILSIFVSSFKNTISSVSLSHAQREIDYISRMSCTAAQMGRGQLPTLSERNVHSVSVLSCVPKVYEWIYYDQMYGYFMGILSFYLSAFRKKYGWHHVLIKLIKDWKSALDRCENPGGCSYI